EFGDIDDSEIVTMLVEHVLIRAGMNKLLEENERDIEKMHELGKLLEEHIRREERIIFPMIEKNLPEDKLEELAPYLHLLINRFLFLPRYFYLIKTKS